MPDGTANIIKKSGLVGGKELVSTIHVKLGYDSALKRAKTMWENEKVVPVTPMLAHKWEDRQKHISEPFYVQPKIDGVRLLVSNKGGISRTGKVVPGTEHWGKGLRKVNTSMANAMTQQKHSKRLRVCIRQTQRLSSFTCLIISTRIDPNSRLTNAWKESPWKQSGVRSKKDLPAVHKQYMEAGYEGTMIREASSVYEVGKRSNYLLKHKDFMTEEYKVIGMRECTGKDVGTPTWVCVTPSGNEFTVRPEGTREFAVKCLKMVLLTLVRC